MWGVRKLPLIGVQCPVCRALGLSSSHREERASQGGVLSRQLVIILLRPRGLPRGGVFLWMERRFLPEERNEEFGADTARHWGHGKRRTENSWGVGSFRDGVEVAI